MWGAPPWEGDGAPWPPPPPSATAMKRLWVAALLLLCVCHAGAVPAHQSEPQSEDPQETPPDTTTLLSRHFQTLSDFFTKELPQRLRADEIQQQAKYVWGWDVGRPYRDPPHPPPKPPLPHRAYAERAEVQLRPLAQELRTNVLGLFSSFLDLGKTGGMEKD